MKMKSFPAGGARRTSRPPKIVVRALDRAAEFQELLDIQRRVWGHDETDLTPAHQFRITSKMGAILLGGYVEGRLAGFVYSFPAVFRGSLVQHSHLLAVLPEFRGCGVGKTLKWAQRDLAISLGYDLITWTFDPLQARNANLNLHALGAIARVYWPNFYGGQAALVLGQGVETDRFLAEWPIREPRVAKRRRREVRVVDAPGMARALERRRAARGTPVSDPQGKRSGGESGAVSSVAGGPDGAMAAPDFALPRRPNLSLTFADILVEVPRSVNDIREKPETIAAWQRALRRVFLRYFAMGYVADDFLCGDRSFYILHRRSARR